MAKEERLDPHHAAEENRPRLIPGWTLDAFDFFLLTFLLTDIATEFQADVPAVSKALSLTLATRFIGAFFFGMLADKYGRKPMLG